MKETRIKKIFDLITQSSFPIKSEELAKKLNFSSRTIRNSIKELNVVLSDNGANIKTVRGIGYKFNIIDKRKFESFLTNRWNDHAFELENYNNPEYRINYILRILLFSNEYIKAQSIIDELNISRSLLNKDLRVVRYLLKKYELEIESKPYQGIKLVGSEVNKRLCIANILFDESDETDVFLKSDAKENDRIFSKIDEIVKNILEEEGYNTSKLSYNNLLIHLFISIKRIRSGDNVSVGPSELLRLETKNEYNISLKITDKLSKEFDINFPKDEIAYVAIHLLSKEVFYGNNKLNISPEIEHLIEEILCAIKIEHNIDLTNDLDLKINLGLHVMPLVERIRYGLILKNPILEDIKKDVMAFKLAITAGEIINKKFTASLIEDEIGYIALHITVSLRKFNDKINKKNVLIVCGSGAGTANLMKYRFIKKYKNHINEIVCSDYFGINNINLEKFDLIVTSVPVNIKFDIPTIQVGIFINDDDIKNIDSFMIEDNEDKIFDKDLIFFTNKFRKKEDVINFLCKEIEDKKNINADKLKMEIKKREEFSSTAFDNRVALPHPLHSITNTDFVTVLISDKGILWEDKKVNIVFLLNLSKCKCNKAVTNFFKELSEFVYDTKRINEVIKTKTFNQFYNVFANRREDGII